MHRSIAICVLFLTNVSAYLNGQIAQSEYAVAAHVGNGVVLAFGATEAATDEADFHQLPSFAYLTGYDRPDAAFVMVVRTGRVAYQMLLEPPTDRQFIAKVRPVVERYNHLGVRIEDDYLVTATGLERLSLAPREIPEIEAAMRRR